jgi:biotin carboxyl carrier protein
VTYEVAINGRTRRVELERVATGYAITVDGHRHVADVTPVNGAFSLLLDGRSCEVVIDEQPPGSGTLTIHLNGRTVSASVGTSRGAWARRGHDHGAAADGPQTVSAPMPGKVVRILVARGDTVAARQGVVVVEAMKMENELRAPKGGTVADVKVAEGTLVEAGTALIVIE